MARPRKTPDGLDFPYSHFGNPEARTQLLKDVAEALKLEPRVVVNVGSGYDITPSDAFPEARVIHTDIAPQVVKFLIEAGFEAYEPQAMPRLEADLSMSILGGDAYSVPLSPSGFVLSTSMYLPEEMGVVGLVDTSEPPNIVTDVSAMEELWHRNEGRNVHLVASQKIN
ncbi:MAG TPA: hypothetical protein VFK97_01110 [Candidatus Saccharimonadales bacterium]|nr:hypothetical protein [Candidatus Saccharimonadales bacterium]